MKLMYIGLMFIAALSMLTRNCIDALNVEVIWWHSPPYIHKNSEGKIDGLVKTFELVSQHACNSSGVTYGRNFSGYDDFMNHVNTLDFYNHANSTAFRLYFPAYHYSNFEKRYLTKEVGFAVSPGMTMVSNSFLSTNLYRLTVNGFNNTKVFLVIICLIMINVGIIIWIAERHLHKKGGDFRTGLLLGVWDAIWFAAVTMTTVGYGDKTPKSKIGRCIGLLWLFMSAALMSGFTAMLTSSLNPTSEIAAKKVVTLNGTLEASYVKEKRGEPVVVNTNEEALKRAESLDVVGALLETNVAAYYQETLFKRHLSIGVPIKKQQNVTMLYLLKDKEKFPESAKYIMCLEQTLMKYADRKRRTLKAERKPTVAEILSGSAVNFPLFEALYAFTGVMIFIGIFIEIKRLLHKKDVGTVNLGKQEKAIEMAVTHPPTQSEHLILILDELKTIKASLKKIESQQQH